MEFAAFIAALLGAWGFAANKDKDEDDTRVEPDPADERPYDENHNPAVDIVFSIDDGVSQSVMEAAADAEAYIEGLFLSAEEFGEQRTLEIRLFEDNIDGDGVTVGWGSLHSTYDDGMAKSGEICIDEQDVSDMEDRGYMDETIEHEIFHVMGFGILWDDFGLIDESDPNNPLFTGEHAVNAYNEATGGNHAGVPLDEGLAHWDEVALYDETMTPAAGDGAYVSDITLASLLDIGMPIDMRTHEGMNQPGYEEMMQAEEDLIIA
jgi:hypothetical protein